MDRLLVAVLLAIKDGEEIKAEEVALLLAYEGRGIRKKLVEALERLAKENNIKRIYFFLGEEVDGEEINDYIEKRGTKMERLLLSMGYEFFNSEAGLIGYKEL